MNIQQVVMSPEWANQLLQNNNHNRKLRPNKVAEIAQDIATGRWMLNPQPIAVSSEGWLLDGQHRLRAIILAKQPVPIMLATDCPPECFKTIDIGIVRSNTDFFKIEGIKYAANIGPVIRYVEFYRNIPGVIWNHNSYPMSKTQIHELYMDQQDAYDKAIEAGARAYGKCKQVNPSILAAMIHLAKNKTKALEYAEQIGSGIGLNVTSPIYMWRQALINGVTRSRTHGMSNSQLQLAGFIKSYNYWREGAEMRVFRLPSIPSMPSILEW
jgi:hypothetical protein